jgi:hypothetical protein
VNTPISKNAYFQTFPYFFLALWSLLLLANFLPSLPQPGAVIGYLWKIEFALAAFLFVGIVSIYKDNFAARFVHDLERFFLFLGGIRPQCASSHIALGELFDFLSARSPNRFKSALSRCFAQMRRDGFDNFGRGLHRRIFQSERND